MPTSRPYLPLSCARQFLAVLGLIYVVTAVLCAALPERSAGLLGYELTDSGYSEFWTTYGGSRLAVGAIFLWPFLRHAETRRVLVGCIVWHAGLVLFRAMSLVFVPQMEIATLAIGIGELAVFLSATATFFLTEEAPLPAGQRQPTRPMGANPTSHRTGS